MLNQVSSIKRPAPGTLPLSATHELTMLRETAKRIFGLLPPRVRQSLRNERDARRARRLRQCLARIGAHDIAVPDVNHLLHHLRGEALSRLPKGVAHFVSVGCAGTWYFEWIRDKCAPKHHTGIEFYSPRPADLPDGVDWIANTAGNMEALGDRSADLLFSGQNIEHLWPDDIGNFLLESHRVLRDGGLLVIDSPNRRVTSLLGWSHPEHTIELELPEVIELLDLAGFDVEHQEGLWLCREPDTGAVLPFDEFSSGGEWPITRRVAEAANHPESSFIWWVQARKRGRESRPGHLRERIRQVNGVAWPERLNRLKSIIGKEWVHRGETWFDSGGRPGALLHGPYTALPPGRHSVTFTLEYVAPAPLETAVAIVQATAANGATILAREEISGSAAAPGQEFTVRLDFELADTTFAVEFVVLAFEHVRLRTPKRVGVTSEFRETSAGH